MVQKLGYNGYPEFQAGLREELRARVQTPIAKHDTWAEAAPSEHILNRFAESVMENLRQTLKQQDPAEFDALVTVLAEPDRAIHVVGGRISHSLASYFYTHMQMMRGGVLQVERNANSWPHYVLNMKKGDVLVLFD